MSLSAKAFRQLALLQVALGRRVRVLLQRASVFVRAVLAIDVSVAENALGQTLPVSALKLFGRTNGFVSLEVRLGQFRTSDLVAVVNAWSPVAGLTFDVEVKT